MDQIKALLVSLDPKVWYLAVSGVVFLLTWAWRRFLPDVWVAAVAKWPALPQVWMTVLGALVSAAPAIGHGVGKVVEETLLGGVFSAIGANGLHAMLRDIPAIPYTGAQKQVVAAFVKRGTPPAGLAPLDGPPPVPKG